MRRTIVKVVVVFLAAALGGASTAVTSSASGSPPGRKFRECGGYLNASRGFFHTPHFPRPFPTPIACKWIIQAPPEGHRIVVYFTQLYLRKGLSAKEYLTYDKYWSNQQETFIGEISADAMVSHLDTEYPFLSIQLDLEDMTNANIRVLDGLMEVHGFNATYEVLKAGAQGSGAGAREGGPRKALCTVERCSYNGHCYADALYRNFSCHCFPNFTGTHCQYGPECDPPRGNVCKNGGHCRYVGSRRFSCVCPPDFNGSYCELRKSLESKECQRLQCSHSCVPVAGGGAYKCACRPGFYLAPTADNATCFSKGLIRFHGSVKLQDSHYVVSKADTAASQAKKRAFIEQQLKEVIGGSVRNMRNLSVLHFKEGGVVEVHFFTFENQSVAARDVWTKAVNGSRFGQLRVNKGHLVFAQEPALSIQSLRAGEGEVVDEGHALMLTCVTYGSAQVRFSWLKDGAEVDGGLSGDDWNTVLNKSLDDKTTAIFNVARVQPAHAGTYTCRVSDWGEVQERPVTIHVQGSPRVLISPRTLSVERGASVSITCLTARVNYNYGFTWVKNNQVHVSSEAELVEDILYPTGSRLKIASAQASTLYSCIVSGVNRRAQKDARITVIHSHVIQRCTAEVSEGLRWGMAASYTEDVQACPQGWRGEASRLCTILNGRALWEEADFSRCMPDTIKDLRFKLSNVRLGFPLATPLQLLLNLSQWVERRAEEGAGLPGEGEPALHLLNDLVAYQLTVATPTLPLANKTAQVFFDVVSALLSSKRALNKEAQALSLVRLVERACLRLGELSHAHRPALSFRRLRPSDELRGADEGLHRKYAWGASGLLLALPNHRPFSSNVSLPLAITYDNLAHFLPKRASTKLYGSEVEYEVTSRVVTVTHDNSSFLLGGYVQVSFANSHAQMNRTGWNLTCAFANTSYGNRFHWLLDECLLIANENATSCRCKQFGTYALLFTSFLLPPEEIREASRDSVVAIGCFVGCVFILLTFVSLILCFRVSFRGFVVMKLHVCVGLFGAMATVLLPSHFLIPHEWYPWLVALLQLFLLEPLTMHVCLELFLYLELANVSHIRNAVLKISLLGWGIPTLVTGATVLVQAQEGFNTNRWWMQVGDTFFFGFTISAGLLLGLYVLLYLVVNLELRQSLSVGSPPHLPLAKRMGLLRRSLLLQGALTAFAFVNVFRGPHLPPAPFHRYAFAATAAATGFLTFLLYTVKSESPGCTCSTADSSSSIKSSAEMSTRSTTTASSHLVPASPEALEEEGQPPDGPPHHHHLHPPPPPRHFRSPDYYSVGPGAAGADVRTELLHPRHACEHGPGGGAMGLVDYEGSPKKYPHPCTPPPPPPPAAALFGHWMLQKSKYVAPPVVTSAHCTPLDVVQHTRPLPDVSCHHNKRDTVV